MAWRFIALFLVVGWVTMVSPADAYITHGKSTTTLVRDAQARYDKAEDLLAKADRCEREKDRDCGEEADRYRDEALYLINEANEIMEEVKERREKR